MPAPTVVCFGPFRFDPLAGTLTSDGRPIAIQAQPARVLALLVAHAGELVTREQLRREIWGDAWVNFDQGLNYCIRQIRLALADDMRAPRYVQTLPQRGYRFVAAISVPAATPAALSGPPSRRIAGKLTYAAAAIALVTIGLGLGLQTAAVLVREVSPASEGAALARHLEPMHLLRGAWTHHLKPMASAR